jgi:hypothetical protein
LPRCRCGLWRSQLSPTTRSPDRATTLDLSSDITLTWFASWSSPFQKRPPTAGGTSRTSRSASPDVRAPRQPGGFEATRNRCPGFTPVPTGMPRSSDVGGQSLMSRYPASRTGAPVDAGWA